jgi:flagellar biosynthetic protein FliP
LALTLDHSDSLSGPVRIVLLLTALSLTPALLIAATSFTRIIIVMSMLRQAVGMANTPPNAVLISLALFLTLFTMSPVISAVDDAAVEPYLAGKLKDQAALSAAVAPIRKFLAAQTREPDLKLVLDLSGKPPPASVDEVGMLSLIPAFMLSELRTGFEIGFVIFLPFVLIDLVVASVLMSLGMIMVPPLAISLPLKVLVFILIDGWGLVTEVLVRSYQQ